MLGAPQCYLRKCKHYEGVKWLGKEETTEVNYCPAFPKGIPADIAYGDNPHDIPVTGQVGNIVFEEDPDWDAF